MLAVSTESKTVVIFRTRLRALMEKQGVTQRELAARSGITHPYINRLLQGRQVPRLDVIEELARGLNVTPSSLLP